MKPTGLIQPSNQYASGGYIPGYAASNAWASNYIQQTYNSCFVQAPKTPTLKELQQCSGATLSDLQDTIALEQFEDLLNQYVNQELSPEQASKFLEWLWDGDNFTLFYYATVTHVVNLESVFRMTRLSAKHFFVVFKDFTRAYNRIRLYNVWYWIPNGRYGG